MSLSQAEFHTSTMFIIKTPEQFRNDAKQVTFDLDGLVLAHGANSMWRYSGEVRDNEAARALVNAYNTQDDKVHTISPHLRPDTEPGSFVPSKRAKEGL